MPTSAKLAAALKLLHDHGPLTRADIARLLVVDRSTAKAVTDTLAGRGLVRERYDGEPHRRVGPGRPSGLIYPCPDQLPVLAIDVGATATRASIVGLGGHELASRDCDRYARGFASWGHLRSALAFGFELSRSLDLPIRGLGVAADFPFENSRVAGGQHGAVATVRELVAAQDWPLPSSEKPSMELPITVHTRAAAGAIGEHRRGAAGTTRTVTSPVVFVIADTHVRVGVIVNEAILESRLDEFSRLTLPVHCPQRTDGSVKSTTAMVWRDLVNAAAILACLGLNEHDSDDIAVQALHALAVESTPSPLDRIVTALFDGLQRLAEVLSPGAIALGGSLLSALPYPAIQASARVMPELHLSRLGHRSSLMGAAESALSGALARMGGA